MPNEAAEKLRTDRARQQRHELKLPVPPVQPTAHPLIVDGPEAVRGGHC